MRMTAHSKEDDAETTTPTWEISYWLPEPHNHWQFICICPHSFACRLLERINQRQPQTLLRLRLVSHRRQHASPVLFLGVRLPVPVVAPRVRLLNAGR
jgi:invasion protein IalB